MVHRRWNQGNKVKECPMILALTTTVDEHTHLRKNSVVAGEVVYTTLVSQWQQHPCSLKGN